MDKAFLILVFFLLEACRQNEQKPGSLGNGPYKERFRPQFHFTPAEKWMNDPNGLVYFKNEYHLFYQHYPGDMVWGPMHWGHATSKDLLHWRHLPIALYPDSLGMIFSGSAVVDVHNTAGFGTQQNPAMVAVYTNHDAAGEKNGKVDFQTQALAYSLDSGKHWNKYDHNPALKNPGKKDFRDPKVFWYDTAKKWIMILAVADHVELYGSENLKIWNKLSEFGLNQGSHGGIWECPDLFPLTVSGTDQQKWVMLVSLNDGGPNGGSATQYFVGDFDGTVFTNDNSADKILWIDYGMDNYAGVTWSDIPVEDGRRIFLGWMSNWKYATTVPTSPWRSAMTIPRTLSLTAINDEMYLRSIPVKELRNLSQDSIVMTDLAVNKTADLSGELRFPLSTSLISGRAPAKDFFIELSNNRDQHVRIGYESSTQRYYVDRRASGNVKFSVDFAPAVIYAPRIQQGRTIGFAMVVDVSSVEVFFDDGTTVMTNLFFPDTEYSSLKIFSTEKDFILDTLKITSLSAVW